MIPAVASWFARSACDREFFAFAWSRSRAASAWARVALRAATSASISLNGLLEWSRVDFEEHLSLTDILTFFEEHL